MKKLVLLAAAVAAIASCAKVETFSTAEPDEITLRPINYSMTKAEHAPGGLAETVAMGVAGYYTTGRGEYFAKSEFTHQADGWGISSGKLYWPGDPIDIFAYAPYTAGLTMADNALNGTAIAADTDLLYGHLTNKSKSTSAVGITLNHAQAKVSFQAKTDGAVSFKITDVSLNNYSNQGNVAIVPTTPEVTWSDQVEAGNKKFTPNSALVLNNGYQAIVNGTNASLADGGILVIPIDACTSTNIVINYTVDNNAAKKTFNLSGTQWQNGKHYIYRFDFSAAEIKLTPTVENWTDENVDKVVE